MSKLKFVMVIVFMVLLVILGCIGYLYYGREGDTSGVKLLADSSSVYSRDDIDKAAKVIFEEFKKYPARMEKIFYDEKMSIHLSKEYDVSDVIVLYSDFTTYSNKSASRFMDFSQSQRYSDWIWILTRDDGEDWVLRDWGY